MESARSQVTGNNPRSVDWAVIHKTFTVVSLLMRQNHATSYTTSPLIILLCHQMSIITLKII